MVTYDGLIQFTLLLVTIVALVYEITKKNNRTRQGSVILT